MKIAIIPARGGSKRIPRKNIRRFRGRPIISWSIEAALEAGVFDDVMVSTDDEEIAEISRSLGASVPFTRSAKAADDRATTPDVLLEVLARYRDMGREYSEACCLYPTAPFATARDLVDGYQALMSGPFDVILPVCAFGYPIWRSLKRDASGRIAMNWPEHLLTRSQDLPLAYHDAGQWYWFEVAAFEREQVLMSANAGSVILPETRTQDIDTEEDWAIAELKHERFFG